MSIFEFIGNEACATCLGNNPSTAPNLRKIEGAAGAQDPKATVDTKQTYNDGKGVKDNVMIKGPLSEAFTQALNVKLKKQPLQPEQEQPTPEATKEQAVTEQDDQKDPMLKKHSDSKFGFATEGLQVDEGSMEYIIREFDQHSAEIDFVANKYDFLSENQLPNDITCEATLISMTDFMDSNKICEVLEKAGNSRSEKVLVVVSDALGRTSATTTQTRFVDILTTGAEYSTLSQNGKFIAACEDYFHDAGIKVVVGIEGFFAFLEDFHFAKNR